MVQYMCPYTTYLLRGVRTSCGQSHESQSRKTKWSETMAEREKLSSDNSSSSCSDSSGDTTSKYAKQQYFITKSSGTSIIYWISSPLFFVLQVRSPGIATFFHRLPLMFCFGLNLFTFVVNILEAPGMLLRHQICWHLPET